jgi:hypothetical protein
VREGIVCLVFFCIDGYFLEDFQSRERERERGRERRSEAVMGWLIMQSWESSGNKNKSSIRLSPASVPTVVNHVSSLYAYPP